MDDALRQLIDRAIGGGEVPVGIHLSLTSGVSVVGTLAPHGKMLEASQPILTEQAGIAIAAKASARSRASDPEVAANQWSSDPSVRDLWSSLSAQPGDDAITLVDVTINQSNGQPLTAPAVRIDATHVAAWWLTTTGS